MKSNELLCLSFGFKGRRSKRIKLALLPGAPERCCKIASAFGDFEELASHREFKTVKAESEEGKILVVSTGIGAFFEYSSRRAGSIGVRLFCEWEPVEPFKKELQ